MMINNDRPRGRGLVMQSDALKAKIQIGGGEVALPDDITLDTMTQTLGVSSSSSRAVRARGADQEEEEGPRWREGGAAGNWRGREEWRGEKGGLRSHMGGRRSAVASGSERG